MPKIHILFDHGEHPFRLDGTVDPEQDPLGCGNLFLHRLSLAGKIFGDIQPLGPLLQRDLICLFCADALFFYGAFLAALAFVNRYLLHMACLGFPRLYRRRPQLSTLCTNIFVLFAVIGHVFSASNIRFVLALLFLLMVRGFYKQRQLLAPIYELVIFFAFIAGIYNHPLHRIGIAQLLQKWNKDLCVRSVRRDIIAYDVLADCRYIYVLARL